MRVCAGSSVPHLSHEHQHRSPVYRARNGAAGPGQPRVRRSRCPDRLSIVRYLALLILAVVFLTGLVWWVVFLGNTVLHLIRRR